VRIIGVIDLLGGRAVHAQGGCRLGYRPVRAVARAPVDGDPAALSRVYVDRLGLRELYVADLDAIGGGAEQDEATRAAITTGGPVWVDAGIATVAQAQRAADRGAAHVVAGLETLVSFDALRAIAASVKGAGVAFSLDLRNGRPVAHAGLRDDTPESLARRAVDAGAGAVIVLELDRIGSGRGVDLALITRMRRAVPGAMLLAGGGVRDGEDLRRLAEAGGDAALVGTALHTGALMPESGFLSS
jgi:phosphoribosylformimino-5-aminoimidazole carboxamide ribotide isomerase